MKPNGVRVQLPAHYSRMEKASFGGAKFHSVTVYVGL